MEPQASHTIISTTPLESEPSGPNSPEEGIQNEGFIPDGEIHREGKLTVVAVTVRKGVKRYGKGTPILNDFNMTVPKGSIYSLLGASGCGKTTVLSCVVGMRHLNSGQIFVFGSKPGTKESGVPGRRVGYMPQEYALYNDFTISEILSYFGTLFGMQNADVKSKGEFLKEFLELPALSQKIGSMSGGQKRRVSLSVALIHSPELLILDEPTVGVDPLLRENIWNHLAELVSTGNTTVIITTHYIEESRKSDRIGLMREGKLLAEDSPTALLEKYKTNILEDIVLTLCKKQATSATSDQVEETNNNTRPRNDSRRVSIALPSPDYDAPSGFQQSLNRIKALAMKNKVVMTRNLLLLIFALLVPPLQTLIMGFTIGHDTKPLNMGVVNYETLNSTSCLDRNVAADECNMSYLSCLFLHQIAEDTFHMREYKNDVLAREAVSKGKVWGFMTFTDDFSQNFVSAFVATSCDRADNNTPPAKSKISMELDMSNAQVGATMKEVIFSAYTSFTKVLTDSCGLNPDSGEVPLDYKTPIYGSDDIDFREYSVPSVVLAVLFFITLSSSGISIIWDKKLGTLERAHIAGVTTPEVLAAYFITEGLTLIIQTALSFIVMRFALGIEVKGSIILALALIFLVGLSGVAMGFMIASFCNEEIEAVLISLALFLPNIVLAGILWPIIGMPKVLYYIAHVLPCTLAAEALRSIVSRGWNLTHQNVWLGFVATICWVCVYCIVTVLIHRRSMRSK